MENIFTLGPHMGANKYNPPNTLNLLVLPIGKRLHIGVEF
jgi:hypothetical protein